MARTTVESPSSIRSCDKVQSPTPAFGSAAKRPVSLPKKPHPRLLPHQSRRPTPTAVPSGVPATVPIPTKSSDQSLPRHRRHSLASHSPANPCPGEACLIAEQPLSKRPERSHSRNHSCPFAKFVVPPFAHFHASNLPHKSPAHHSHTPFPKSAKPSVFIHAPRPPVHRSSPAPAPTSTFHPRPKTRRPQLRPPPVTPPTGYSLPPSAPASPSRGTSPTPAGDPRNPDRSPA